MIKNYNGCPIICTEERLYNIQRKYFYGRLSLEYNVIIIYFFPIFPILFSSQRFDKIIQNSNRTFYSTFLWGFNQLLVIIHCNNLIIRYVYYNIILAILIKWILLSLS